MVGTIRSTKADQTPTAQASPVTSLPPMSFPLTPDLERLDAFVITGTVDRPPSSVNTSSCGGGGGDLRWLERVERPVDSGIESFSWQRLSAASHKSLVFSAHYDTRWRPASLIQIVGMSSEWELGTLFCRMWFADSRQPVFSSATVQHIGETHGRRLVSNSPCAMLSACHQTFVLQNTTWVWC